MKENKIVLGSVQFGIDYGINNNSGQVRFNEVKKILSKAYEAGVRVIDTSSGYGNSEAILGQAMKECNTRFNIVSKYAPSDIGLSESFYSSLNNLGLNELYGYLVHSFDYYLDHTLIYEEMEYLKSEGRIKKIGFSIYTIQQLQYLLDHNVMIDILQFPYNIFDRQFEAYMPQLAEMGVEIHTRSAFLQGLFFKDTNTLPEKLKPLKKYLDSLHDYCDNKDISIEQIAFGYVLANENVKGALIGVDNLIQLENNLKVASHQLSKLDIDFIMSLEIKEKDLLNPVNWN